MKKFIYTLLIGILFVACGSNDSNNKEDTKNKKEVLYIYNWNDYIPQKIYNQFSQETGITIIEDLYSSNEELYEKVKNGNSPYDLIVPSQDYLERLIKENMLEKIDRNKISTYKNISPTILNNLCSINNCNSDYAVPFAVGVSGLLINKKFVTEDVKDFSILQNEKYRGKITLLADMREVMVPALLTLGYNQNTTNPKELEEAQKLLKSWIENIDKFETVDSGSNYNNETHYIVQCYIDNIYNLLEGGQFENSSIIISEKGSLAYVDSFAILKNAKNKKNAIKFIEFMHRPDVYAELIDSIQIPSLNKEAEKLRKSKPLYDIETLKKIKMLEYIDNETLEIQTKYWEEVKKIKEEPSK